MGPNYYNRFLTQTDYDVLLHICKYDYLFDGNISPSVEAAYGDSIKRLKQLCLVQRSEVHGVGSYTVLTSDGQRFCRQAGLK